MRSHGSSSETRTYQKKQRPQWVPSYRTHQETTKNIAFNVIFQIKICFFLCLKQQTCSCLQCGRSSSNAKGSKTFPDMMCPPISIITSQIQESKRYIKIERERVKEKLTNFSSFLNDAYRQISVLLLTELFQPYSSR